jgi:DNA-binding MarR family transcriptional regulator
MRLGSIEISTLKKKRSKRDRLAFTDDSNLEWRHHNFGRLLLNAFRYFEHGLIVRLHSMGHEEIRRVHLSVMRQMDFGGTGVTVLAERAGVTKQAMSHFVQKCEDLGYVSRQRDPEDGRGIIVVFTAKGKRLMTTMKGIIDVLEAEMTTALGEKKTEAVREGLKVFADRLGQDDILYMDED